MRRLAATAALWVTENGYATAAGTGEDRQAGDLTATLDALARYSGTPPDAAADPGAQRGAWRFRRACTGGRGGARGPVAPGARGCATASSAGRAVGSYA